MIELSETQFEVLQTAVNIAKNDQIHSVVALRSALAKLYKSTDIDQAISYWSSNLGQSA